MLQAVSGRVPLAAVPSDRRVVVRMALGGVDVASGGKLKAGTCRVDTTMELTSVSSTRRWLVQIHSHELGPYFSNL